MGDEHELVRRLRRREEAAMGELYERFGATVFAIALRMVRNPSTAEDLAQETFLRIWNGIDHFDEMRGSLGCWVAAVTRNRVLDYIRSADYRVTRASCELMWVDQQAKQAPVQGPDELQARTLNIAVLALADNHRRVVELAYVQGLSQSEIALRIDRPVGTIKTWARGALKSLREQILLTGAATR